MVINSKKNSEGGKPGRGTCSLKRVTKASWLDWDCCCCCRQVASVMSDSVRPHRQQPTKLPHPWDSPGWNTGVGCHLLLQCMKVKSESEVAQSCPTLATPWTAAYQAPPPMGFSRQEYWSGVPLPSPSIRFTYLLICYPPTIPLFSECQLHEDWHCCIP